MPQPSSQRGKLRKESFPLFFCPGHIILLAVLLIFTFHACPSYAQQVTLVWDPNTETDLGGYRVYSGTASRTYPNVTDVGNCTNCTITGLVAGSTYYFAVTALDTAGNESGYSNEATYTTPAPPLPSSEELIIADTPHTAWNLGNRNNRMLRAQSFRATGNRIESVTVALAIVRTPDMPVLVSIRTSLEGSVLASAEIPPAQVTSTVYSRPTWINVVFPLAAQVTVGATYYLVLETAAYDSREYYKVVLGGNSYPDGEAYLDADTPRSELDVLCKIKFAY